MGKFDSRSFYIWVKAFDLPKPAASEGGSTSTVVIFKGDRPPIAANAEESCRWVFDLAFDGTKEKIGLGYSPHTGTREEAIEWLESRRGKKWLVGAETFELLSFEKLPE